MSKYNYDSERDDDRFPPCIKCGSEEVDLNIITDLYSCATCGETLREQKGYHLIKPPKAAKKKVRLDWK